MSIAIRKRPWGLTVLLLLACAGFVALGIWQVQRMHWKHDLIAKVDARVHAAPVDLPAHARLVSAAPGSLDYLRVRLSGAYGGARTALVRASTDLGAGYWVMTPMTIADGSSIWINRGFVPAGTALVAARGGVPTGTVEVTGLLRSSEPGGSLLQANRPQDDRWYSRDVTALSHAKRVERPEPVFVDVQQERPRAAERTPEAGATPVPGLTVIRFPDNHLSYALTWFALAALSAAGVWLAWRRPAGAVLP